jgi:PAS domain-containing protein
VDPPDADVERFPLRRVSAVRERTAALLRARAARVVVSSGACGADLIAQGEAAALGLRGRIVLPFEAGRFRETSVTDRPGEWGGEFDRLVARVREAGDLVVLEGAGEGTAAYAAANAAILDEADRLAASLGLPPLAVIVWDGAPRGPGDLTEAFAAAARGRGWEVAEVETGGKGEE